MEKEPEVFSATRRRLPQGQAVFIAILTGVLLSSAGCNSMGAGKQLKQLEVENNRLLSEFRAERQRRESAERSAQQLEMRLAESEKMLARQLNTGSSPGRLSSLPTGSGSMGLADPNSLSNPAAAGDLKWHRRN